MKLNKITKALLFSAIAMPSLSVMAQEEESKEDSEKLAIEVIEVSARKVKEVSQEVPISMSVISADSLDQIAAFEFKDISKLAPGLEISGDDAVSGTIKMRGVGRDAFAGNMDDSVVVFIDGVAQTSVGAAFGSLSDIQRVEVLRGPQGTLYGRNAPAGAINVTTKNIDLYDVKGGVSTSHFFFDETSTYGTSNKAHINLPIIEGEFGIRVSAFYDDSEGFVTNKLLDKPANNSDRKGVRLKAQYIPTNNLDFTFIANSSENYNGRVFSYTPGFGPEFIAIKEAAANGTANSSDTFASRLGDDIPLGSPDDFVIYSDIRDHSTTKLQDAQLNFNWDGENHAIKSITYAQNVKTTFVSDQNGTPIQDGHLQIQTEQDLFSQELQLFNTDGGDLEYLIGVYYSKLEGKAPDGLGSQFNQYGVSFPVQLPVPPYFMMAPADIRTVVTGTQDNESLGYFANASYTFNDEWSGSIGIRYNDETKSSPSSFFVDGELSLFGQVSEIPRTDLDGVPDEELSFTDVSHSVKVNYKPNEDVMFYIALDSAYRSGGFNMSTVAPLESLRTFEPEESDAIEIGMKGSFLDNRLQWNIDYYYQEFENYQFGDLPRQDNNATRIFTDVSDTVPVNAVTMNQSHVLNAKKAVSSGIETDFIYLVSKNFVLSGGLTVIDTEYKEFKAFCDTGEGPASQLYCDYAGQEIGSNFGLAPATVVANLSPLFHTDVNSWGVKLSNSLQINYDDVKDTYVDYRLGFEPLNGNWSAQLFIKNVFDEKPGQIQKTPLAGSTDTFRYDLVAPRQIGFTLGYKF